MSLSSGQSLSHYRLTDPIGQGGMGVVWKATDTTLGRSAAIKVLPDAFASDPERLARFEREARLLAALNHPHIAAVHGLHSADGVRFLAMEFVEGEDLSARIGRGPIPVAEALPLALQIAQALEHAHEHGVIHRDLKPANVKLTTGGQAKVLDFGLAKALEGEFVQSGASPLVSQSPTITNQLTSAHVLLGTAAYMAPEQARGQIADKRADIWAFGVVLMEMLTGRRLFEGETISDTLASVLKTDPDLNALPADTPRRVRALIARCLARSPRLRLRDIGEARITLEEVIAGKEDDAPAAPAAAAPAPRRGGAAYVFGVAGLAVGALLAMLILRGMQRPPAEAPLVKFRLPPPGEGTAAPSHPAISPDGRTVAYLSEGKLCLQALGELEPRTYDVENGATRLFWSPDGDHVAYLAGTRITKVTAAGGGSQAICDTRGALSGGQGATWRGDGSVVFSRGDSMGLLEVPALGGDPRPLLRPDSTETDLHEPFALPGGRGVLFVPHRRQGGMNSLWLWSEGRRKLLLEQKDQTISWPVYSPTGHILFARTPTTPGIWAVPFSLSRLEVTGEPVLVAPGGARPTVSDDGTLAYVAGSGGGAVQLAWMDNAGREIGEVGAPEARGSREYTLAPDGRRIAWMLSEGDNQDIWILDAARGTRTRFTFDTAQEQAARWSPTGDRIVYNAAPRDCSGPECWRIVMRSASGTGAADTIGAGILANFTPDGQHVIHTVLARGGANWNLATAPLAGDRTPATIVRGNPRVADGMLSPSRPWLAYTSDESGQWEVYLTHYPDGEGRWQVSTGGGQWPHWNSKGRHLYYVEGETVMEVEVTGTDAPVLGAPRKVLTRPGLGTWNFGWYTDFEMTGDGAKFLVLKPAGERGRAPGVTVVQNWFAEFADKK